MARLKGALHSWERQTGGGRLRGWAASLSHHPGAPSLLPPAPPKAAPHQAASPACASDALLLLTHQARSVLHLLLLFWGSSAFISVRVCNQIVESV